MKNESEREILFKYLGSLMLNILKINEERKEREVEYFIDFVFRNCKRKEIIALIHSK